MKAKNLDKDLAIVSTILSVSYYYLDADFNRALSHQEQ